MSRYEGITYKGTNIEFEDLKAVENAAGAFSTSQAYATGDYCTNEGTLYQFVVDHSAGAWNAEHVRQVHISDKLNELDDQTDNLNRVVDILAANLQPKTWGYYKNLLDGGFAQKYYPVGSQMIDKWAKAEGTEYECPWDIAHYDASGNAYLKWHWGIPDVVAFDAPEAIYYVGDDGLPAGTYHIGIGKNYGTGWSTEKSIQFTLAVALEKDDQIYIECSTNANNDPTNGRTLKTFSKGSTTAKETTTTSNGTGGTSLGSTSSSHEGKTNGQVNAPQRVVYGYGRWSQSAIRQYLNSSAGIGLWWSAQNPWDRPPAQASTLRGFLAGCPEDFLSILALVDVVTALNTVEGFTDSYETTQDKIFLPSLQEMYITPQLDGVEGVDWDYYKALAQEIGLQGKFGTGSSNVYPELITYSIANHSSAVYSRLRSAVRSNANTAWSVASSGYASYGTYAYYAFSASPACKILKSV